MSDLSSEAMQVGRAVLYRFLALAFHEPGEQLNNTLSDSEQLAQLHAAAQEVDSVGETRAVYAALVPLLEATPSEGWPLSDLRVEYTRMFFGPGEPACPPYESVHDQSREKEDRGTVQGPSAERMARALAAEGLEINLGYVELPDHIALELEYMVFLLQKALESDDSLENEYLAKANLFLKNHLSHWVPGFGEQVAERSQHPYYQRLGRLLTSFVRLDDDLFGSGSVSSAAPGPKE
jgi:putative dimethyl sulfoxide reductase chaperone